MNFSIGIYSCPMDPIHLVGLYTTRLPVFRWKARGYDWILVDSIGQPSNSLPYWDKRLNFLTLIHFVSRTELSNSKTVITSWNKVFGKEQTNYSNKNKQTKNNYNIVVSCWEYKSYISAYFAEYQSCYKATGHSGAEHPCTLPLDPPMRFSSFSLA